MELTPDELDQFASDEMNLNPFWERPNFIDAVEQSIALSNAAAKERLQSAHSKDNDDEKKMEMDRQELLKSISNEIDVNLQEIDAFLNGEMQSESKEQLDGIEQVFDLFTTKLMDRESKLIDEFNVETEGQMAAIKAFQSEMKALKQSIDELLSLKDKSTIVARRKELMESRYVEL